jgi:uncharacterized protein (TIGR02246 family)
MFHILRPMITATTILLVGCSDRREPASAAGAADTAEATAGIDALESRFLAAYTRDDFKAIAESYTEDVRFIQDGSAEEGRARMEEGWKSNVASLSDLKLTTVTRVVRGDIGVLTQRFSQQYRTPEGKTVTDSGYFVGMVRREPDGQWRYQTVVLSRPPEKQ